MQTGGRKWCSSTKSWRSDDAYIYLYIPLLFYSPSSRLTHLEAKRGKKWTVSPPPVTWMRKASWWLCGTAAGMAARPAHTGSSTGWKPNQPVLWVLNCYMFTKVLQAAIAQTTGQMTSLYRTYSSPPLSGVAFISKRIIQITFCLLFSICKVTMREINPDLNRKGMGEKEAKETNQMLFFIRCQRRKFCVTAAEQLAPREISPGCGEHLRASKLLVSPLTFDSTSALWSFCRSRAAALVSSLRAAMCRAGRRTFPFVSFSSSRETTWSWPCCKATAKGVKPSCNTQRDRQRLLQTFHRAGRAGKEISALQMGLAHVQPSATS